MNDSHWAHLTLAELLEHVLYTLQYTITKKKWDLYLSRIEVESNGSIILYLYSTKAKDQNLYFFVLYCYYY
jgi:hypothetical protein